MRIDVALAIVLAILVSGRINKHGYEALISESTVIALTTIINLSKHKED